MSSDIKTVVVVGGGSGALAARQLSTVLDPSKHQLIFISARPHFQHYIASIRAAVTPEGAFDEQTIMPFDKLLVNGNGSIIHAEVTSVSEESEKGGSVTLSNGDTIHWDALVLATGSTWEGPLDIPHSKTDALEWFKGWQAKFADAQDVLLVGGGAIAIEYAGEIKDLDSSKTVTIVHSDNLLLNKAYPDKFRKNVEKSLRARGVNLLLGDFVANDALTSTSIVTRNGKTLTPDLVVPCRGPRPNTSFISASLGPNTLSPAGHVKIHKTFQLLNHPRIFACGDIADLNEQRQIGKYAGHVDVIVKNVLALFNEQPIKTLYKGATEMIVITLGKEGGASYLNLLWGITFGDWASAALKSRTLLVSRIRSKLGL